MRFLEAPAYQHLCEWKDYSYCVVLGCGNRTRSHDTKHCDVPLTFGESTVMVPPADVTLLPATSTHSPTLTIRTDFYQIILSQHASLYITRDVPVLGIDTVSNTLHSIDIEIISSKYRIDTTILLKCQVMGIKS